RVGNMPDDIAIADCPLMKSSLRIWAEALEMVNGAEVAVPNVPITLLNGAATVSTKNTVANTGVAGFDNKILKAHMAQYKVSADLTNSGYRMLGGTQSLVRSGAFKALRKPRIYKATFMLERAPKLAIATDRITFPSVPLGASAPAVTVAVRNTGIGPLHV